MVQLLFLSSDPVFKRKNIDIIYQSGLVVEETDSLLNGILKTDKKDFDVIIIDEELSDTDGYNACLQLRQHSDAPIILLGTKPESLIWDKVSELGFDFYLSKPVSPRELIARIKALLRRPPISRKTKELNKETTFLKYSQEPISIPYPKITTPATPEYQETLAKPTAARKEPERIPPKKNTVVCVYCEWENPPDVKYCGACGSRLYIEPSNSPVTEVPEIKIKSHEGPIVIEKPSEKPPATKESPMSKPAVTRTFETPIVVETASKRTESIEQEQLEVQTPTGEGDLFQTWEDSRVIQLVEALVSGKMPEIVPLIDLSSKIGFKYPQVGELIEATDEEIINMLESLANNNILVRKPYEKLYLDPDDTFQLVQIERCPYCDSGNLIKGQLVEHFSCGYIGMEQDFRVDHRYVCPKCHKDLRLIGTDYRNTGIHYRCLECNQVFTTPAVKWRNLVSRKIWNNEDLREMWVYTYTFSPDKKEWLEFQLKPKAQLIDFLKLQGYQVEELAQVSGSSGAVHTIDIFATRDDILTKVNLGIGILVTGAGESEVNLEELFKFDTRAYDIGINYKVIIAIPKLNQEAAKFAERQQIRAFEAKSLGALVTEITQQHQGKVVSQPQTDIRSLRDEAVSGSDPRGILVKFLKNRGYEVFERARLIGKSGADHVFDIFARRDDGIVEPSLVIKIGIAPSGQTVEIDELSQFDAEAYDAGIKNKVFIAIPKVSTQAAQFARQQKIKAVEARDLRNYLSIT